MRGPEDPHRLAGLVPQGLAADDHPARLAVREHDPELGVEIGTAAGCLVQCRIDVRSVVGMDAPQECLDRLAEHGQVVTEHLDEPLVPAQVAAGQVEVEAADPRRDHGQSEPSPDGVEVGRQRRQLELADRHGSELGEQRDVAVRPPARLGPEDAQGTAGTTVGVDQRHPEVRAETARRHRHHRCYPPVAGRVVDEADDRRAR